MKNSFLPHRKTKKGFTLGPYERDKNIQLHMYLSLNTFYDKSLFTKKVLELEIFKNNV